LSDQRAVSGPLDEMKNGLASDRRSARLPT